MATIQKQPVSLRAFAPLKTHFAALNGGKAQPVMTVRIPLELDATDEVLKADPWRHLFPFAAETMSLIAGREGEEKRGTDITARGQVTDLHVELYDGEIDDKPAFNFQSAVVAGKPRLAIDEDGKGVIHLKVKAVLSKRDFGELGPYIDASLFCSLTTAQRTIDEQIAENKAAAEGNATIPEKKQKPPKEDRWVSGLDSKEGSIAYVFTTDADAFVKSALSLHTDLREPQIVEAARKLARVNAGLQARRVSVSLDNVKDVVDTLVGPSIVKDLEAFKAEKAAQAAAQSGGAAE